MALFCKHCGVGRVEAVSTVYCDPLKTTGPKHEWVKDTDVKKEDITESKRKAQIDTHLGNRRRFAAFCSEIGQIANEKQVPFDTILQAMVLLDNPKLRDLFNWVECNEFLDELRGESTTRELLERSHKFLNDYAEDLATSHDGSTAEVETLIAEIGKVIGERNL